MDHEAFCTNCGAPIKGDEEYCTECGARLKSSPGEEQAPTPVSYGQVMLDGSSGSPNIKGKQRKKWPIVLVVCVVIVLIISVAGAFFIFGQGKEGLGAIFSPQSEQESSSENETASADQQGTNETLVTIDDQTRFAINRYLSNFTELGQAMDGYSADNASSVQMFDFAWGHTLLNAPRSVTELPHSKIFIGDKEATARIDLKILDNYTKLFLKRSITANDLPADVAKYTNGSVYSWWNLTSPHAVAFTNEVYQLSDSTYKVTFEAYGEGTYYEVTDESIYKLNRQGIMRYFDQTRPDYTGTAVIEAGYDDDTAPFKLLSFKLDE